MSKQEKLEQAFFRLLNKQQDRDTANETFGLYLCDESQSCVVNFAAGTVNIFDEDGEEVDFFKFSTSIALDSEKSLPLKVKVHFFKGSREVEITVYDTRGDQPVAVFEGGGVYDGDNDDWLTVEVHNRSLVETVHPDLSDEDKDRLARSLVQALIEADGETFADAEDLLDHFGQTPHGE